MAADKKNERKGRTSEKGGGKNQRSDAQVKIFGQPNIDYQFHMGFQISAGSSMDGDMNDRVRGNLGKVLKKSGDAKDNFVEVSQARAAEIRKRVVLREQGQLETTGPLTRSEANGFWDSVKDKLLNARRTRSVDPS